jgi:hypothetical protein
LATKKWFSTRYQSFALHRAIKNQRLLNTTPRKPSTFSQFYGSDPVLNYLNLPTVSTTQKTQLENPIIYISNSLVLVIQHNPIFLVYTKSEKCFYYEYITRNENCIGKLYPAFFSALVGKVCVIIFSKLCMCVSFLLTEIYSHSGKTMKHYILYHVYCIMFIVYSNLFFFLNSESAFHCCLFVRCKRFDDRRD